MIRKSAAKLGGKPFVISDSRIPEVLELTIEPGRRIPEFALSIDIAPTLIAAAGAERPATVQGRSLLPLLREPPPADWRQSFLVEFHSHENPMPWTANLDYRVVRMGRYKYIRWTHEPEAAELYDVEADPYAERNLAGVPAMAEIVARAKEELAGLVLESMGLRQAPLA
mgnify:CR=1 FL=1